MIIWEIFKMAASALRVNKMRSFLTLLGVILGVASVITIISALEGMSQSIQKELESLGPATFIVTRFGIITSFDDFMNALKRKPINPDYASTIEKGCPECSQVAPYGDTSGEVKYRNKKLRRVYIQGGTSNLLDIVDTKIDQGRFHTAEEDHTRSRVAFIGTTVREELFPGIDPIGKEIKINNVKYTVIGIAEKKGSSMNENADKRILVPFSAFMKDFASRRHDVSIFVKAVSVDELPVAMDRVRVILRAHRHVPYDKDDDFSIVTADAIMAVVKDTTKYIRFGLVGISSIALVVGGIIIMNIMMVSVTERTREIGIRKSIGARQRDILLQFLYEALILSLGGGAIGITIGVFLGKVLIGLIKMDMTPSMFAIATGLIISLGTGLFFGIYPAMKAARMQPVKALSYE
jgi:putative ABC transport system permease protein